MTRVSGATALVIAMLTAGPAAATDAAQTAADTPAPAPSSTGSDHLKEIAHVRAVTPFCKSITEKTQSAVTLLLDNDRKVGEAENVLQLGDFDKNEMTRHNAIVQLQDEAVSLRRDATTGNGQMKLLREEIANAPTPAQAAALQKFQQALDGGLMRQKRLADRMMRMVVILANRPQIDDEEAAKQHEEALQQMNNFYAWQDPQGPTADLPDTVTAIAKASADELRLRSVPIVADENDASDKMDDAFVGCR